MARTFSLAAGMLGLAGLPAVAEPGGAWAATGGHWHVTLGADVSGGTGADGILDIEYRSDREAFWTLKPSYSFAIAADGGVLLAASVRKDFQLGPVTVSAHTGPALYQSDWSDFDGDEVLQFRSGLDLSLPLGPATGVTAGIYHVSNAGLTDASADMDVARLGLDFRF